MTENEPDLLTVELAPRTRAALLRLSELEARTYSTIVNRAVQIYERVMYAQRGGLHMELVDDSGRGEAIRID